MSLVRRRLGLGRAVSWDIIPWNIIPWKVVSRSIVPWSVAFAGSFWRQAVQHVLQAPRLADDSEVYDMAAMFAGDEIVADRERLVAGRQFEIVAVTVESGKGRPDHDRIV